MQAYCRLYLSLSLWVLRLWLSYMDYRELYICVVENTEGWISPGEAYIMLSSSLLLYLCFSVCMTMYKCMFFTLIVIRRKSDGKTHQINSKIKVIYMNKNMHSQQRKQSYEVCHKRLWIPPFDVSNTSVFYNVFYISFNMLQRHHINIISSPEPKAMFGLCPHTPPKKSF